MRKGKLVRNAKVSKFEPPSFEGSGRGARAEGRGGARHGPRTPGDAAKEERRKGFEEGKREGTESVLREASRLLSGLRCAVDSVSALREQVVREAEPQLVDLAMAVARRVVIDELAVRPERITAIVREAIRKIEKTGPVTVKVHPDLYRLIEDLRGDLADPAAEILFDVDPSVPAAGPVVTGATEEILTDVDEQIRVIAEEIRSERATR